MKKWIWLILILVSASGGAAYYQLVYNQPPSLGEQCLEVHKSKLLDPYSVKLESFSARGDKVEILFRAKNAYGAYMPGTYSCYLAPGGKEVAVYKTKLEELND